MLVYGLWVHLSKVYRGLVYTSNKSEGEPGFAFPEGFPEGRLASEASRPEGNPEGKANPGSPELLLEVYHSLLSYLNGQN